MILDHSAAAAVPAAAGFGAAGEVEASAGAEGVDLSEPGVEAHILASLFGDASAIQSSYQPAWVGRNRVAAETVHERAAVVVVEGAGVEVFEVFEEPAAVETTGM